MAYALYEKPQLKSPKNVQYYPEEYDYSNYYNVGGLKHIDTTASKKNKKILPSIEYENERKCPIYIHQFNKFSNLSITNNYSPKTYNNSTVVKQPNSKIGKPKHPKLTLDKLEETYWATWKPNKETRTPKSPKMRSEKQAKLENKRRKNETEHVMKYFESLDFPNSSGSCLHGPENSSEPVDSLTNTQEIQTDYLPPLMTPDYVKHLDSVISISEKKKKATKSEISYKSQISNKTQVSNKSQISNKSKISNKSQITNKSQETMVERFRESQVTVISAEDNVSCETIFKDDLNSNETLLSEDLRSSGTLVKEDDSKELNTSAKSSEKSMKKLLNHTDSFIIHRKKQDEIRDVVQQPRCIKLYKKTPTTFLKGGSYPLKSCIKKASTEKGNFRLGAPGSPLFVTSSSFNKKYCR
ncbi:uncharacterized protein [Leptinotarsa decemlineata]|uniref:uncharacterized protein n=1 Tax=Leptinotarsa decemlineata TaxID=7539 RepID=UPI003D307639